MSEPPFLDADPGRSGERHRQGLLLDALRRRASMATLAEAVVESPGRLEAAVHAYRSNAAAAAERALGASFPVLRALVGEESFDALANAYWQARPPQRGDLARLGDDLPAFIDADPLLADVPYLADVARLECALARSERAADARLDAATLEQLANADPESVTIDLVPAAGIVASRWPIVTIWRAHQPGGDFAAARAALTARTRETAFVWRSGWRAVCEPIAGGDARFTSSLLAAQSLGAALDAAGDAFRFDEWLLRAVRHGWLVRVRDWHAGR